MAVFDKTQFPEDDPSYLERLRNFRNKNKVRCIECEYLRPIPHGTGLINYCIERNIFISQEGLLKKCKYFKKDGVED